MATLARDIAYTERLMHYPNGSWPRSRPPDYEEPEPAQTAKPRLYGLFSFPLNTESGLPGVLAIVPIVVLFASPIFVIVQWGEAWPWLLIGLAMFAYVILWKFSQSDPRDADPTEHFDSDAN